MTVMPPLVSFVAPAKHSPPPTLTVLEKNEAIPFLQTLFLSHFPAYNTSVTVSHGTDSRLGYM